MSELDLLDHVDVAALDDLAVVLRRPSAEQRAQPLLLPGSRLRGQAVDEQEGAPRRLRPRSSPARLSPERIAAAAVSL